MQIADSFLCKKYSCLLIMAAWAAILSPTASFCQESPKWVQIDSLNEVAFELRNSDPKMSLELSTRSLALSEKEAYEKGKAIALNTQGIYHKNKNRWVLARQFFFQSLQIRNEIGDQGLIAQQLLNIGNFFRGQNQVDSALYYYQKALDIQLDLGNDSKVTAITSNMALVYKDLGRYDQALEILYENLAFLRKQGDQKAIANAIFRVAEVNEKIGNLEKAKSEYKEATTILYQGGDSKELATSFNNLGNVMLAEGKIDSAELLYSQSGRIRKDLGLTADLPGTFLNLGEVARIKGKYALAKSYTMDAISLFRQAQNPFGEVEGHFLLGEIAFAEGSYDDAKSNFEYCLSLISPEDLSSIHLQVLERMAEISSTNEDFKAAYSYSSKRSAMLDSVNKQIISAENIIRTQEIKINNLEHQVKLNESEAKQELLMRILYLAGGFVLFLVGVLLVFAQRQRNRQKHIIRERAREVDRLMEEHSLKLLEGMVRGQAEERRKISHELHGQLGTMLSTAKIYLDGAIEGLDKDSEKSSRQLADAQELIGTACEEVRNISHGLSDEMVLRYGFQQAIADLIERINNSGKLKMEFISSVRKMRFEEGFEIAVFRITQDLISNILKHSKASNGTVQYLKNDDRLSIMVEDNGVGFSMDSKKVNQGLGIASIRSRVEEKEGTIAIDSTPGNGTTIMIELPIPNSENNHDND